MIARPNLGDNGEWLYDVDAIPKSSEYIPSDKDVEYSVLKLWKDTADTSNPLLWIIIMCTQVQYLSIWD